MKYLTMDNETNEVVTTGDTREEAREALKPIATEGKTYLELKVLGEPLSLRTRKVTTLGAAKAPATAEPEAD